MTETQTSRTNAMFASLAKLYKQGQLLLMDADRLMDERGWEPRGSTAPAALSSSLKTPERWYARWAARFYWPTVPDGEEAAIDRILYVGIHFASDQDTAVDEPIVSAGRLSYGTTMSVEEAGRSYLQWMCKYWFFGESHKTRKGWRQGGQSRYFDNLKRSEAVVVPLYDITSSEKLEKLVIDQLLSVD